MDIEVGQIWKTRDGGTSTVLSHNVGEPYPFIMLSSRGLRYSVNQDGQELNTAGRGEDLVELVRPKPDLITQVVATLESTLPSAPDLLDKAAGHIRERAATYDSPGGERSMAKTVALFNLHHDTALTEAQGWHFMQILKDVRLFSAKGYHADSAEDGIAYKALMSEAKAKEGAQ